MNADQDTCHRLQRQGIDHPAADLHRIEYIAGGKSIAEVFQDIPFVVVGQTVGKVDRIGGTVAKIIAQLDGQHAAIDGYFRLFDLWWRDDHRLVLFQYLDSFIE